MTIPYFIVPLDGYFSLPACCLDQRLEQQALWRMILQPFRMPLNAYPKWMTRQFHAFNQAVRSMRYRLQNRSDVIQPLVMQAVHLERLSAKELGQAATRNHRYRMRKIISRDVWVPIMAE
jgi:hypothetical protein